MGRAARLFLILALSALPAAASHAFENTGSLAVEGAAFGPRQSRDDPAAELKLKGTSKWEERLGDTFFTLSLRGMLSSEDEPRLYLDPADRKRAPSALALEELYLRAPLNPRIDLQVGRFLLGWGKTDGYSPADAFLPRDLTDPFADEKLPLWGARATAQWDDLRVDAVAVPVTTPWRLPEPGSRYAPLPFPTALLRQRQQHPPENGFGAVRFLLTAGDWDLGWWFRFGARPAPLIHYVPDLLARRIDEVRSWAREEAVGVELSRILGPWIARGELAALHSSSGEAGDALIWSLGLERSGEYGIFTATLAGEEADREKGTVLYDRALLPLFVAAWSDAPAWGDWKAVWTAGLGHGDGLVKVEAGYSLTDFWRLSLESELPYGSSKGPLGALKNGRRAKLAVTRYW